MYPAQLPVCTVKGMCWAKKTSVQSQIQHRAQSSSTQIPALESGILKTTQNKQKTAKRPLSTSLNYYCSTIHKGKFFLSAKLTPFFCAIPRITS